MKRLASLAAATLAAASLGACMDDMGYHHGPYAGAYISGYYDDAYGPFYDGYWGDGGVFYYRTGPTGEFRRDDAHHFRHDAGQGFHNFRAPDGQGHHDSQGRRDRAPPRSD